MRTQVGIVGAGPAGLVLSHLLHLEGIDSVVLERRSRSHIENRVRAGVLEHGTAALLTQAGVGERMRREGMVHRGLAIRFAGRSHRIDLAALTSGRTITVYGQQEIIKDLVAARLAAGGQVLFEAEALSMEDIDGNHPVIRFQRDDRLQELHCDIIAGCDGFHGVSRSAIPVGARSTFERIYPFAWLGVLARTAPSSDELIYTYHDRGFALHSMRSPEITRLYLQVPADTRLDSWPTGRIWSELHTRLATGDGFVLREGPVLESAVTPMRTFVAEPMRHGRLFLAGDAAHIVPPTGAKGLNLAVSDVYVLAEGLAAWFRHGRTALLDGYSARCLRRVWQVQHFSWWMTSMFHRQHLADEITHRLQLAQLEYLAGPRRRRPRSPRTMSASPWDWGGRIDSVNNPS